MNVKFVIDRMNCTYPFWWIQILNSKNASRIVLQLTSQKTIMPSYACISMDIVSYNILVTWLYHGVTILLRLLRYYFFMNKPFHCRNLRKSISMTPSNNGWSTYSPLIETLTPTCPRLPLPQSINTPDSVSQITSTPRPSRLQPTLNPQPFDPHPLTTPLSRPHHTLAELWSLFHWHDHRVLSCL